MLELSFSNLTNFFNLLIDISKLKQTSFYLRLLLNKKLNSNERMSAR